MSGAVCVALRSLCAQTGATPADRGDRPAARIRARHECAEARLGWVPRWCYHRPHNYLYPCPCVTIDGSTVMIMLDSHNKTAAATKECKATSSTTAALLALPDYSGFSSCKRPTQRARICDVRIARVSIDCCTRRSFCTYSGRRPKVASSESPVLASRALRLESRSCSAAWRACNAARSSARADADDDDAGCDAIRVAIPPVTKLFSKGFRVRFATPGRSPPMLRTERVVGCQVTPTP